MFVVDASVVSNWCLPDETHPYADVAKIKIATEDAITAAIFWSELRNVLLSAERRGRISEEQTTELLAAVSELAIQEDQEMDEAAVLTLARKHGLTVYDAAYLALAQREGIALATLDQRLISASKGEKVQIVGEAE